MQLGKLPYESSSRGKLNVVPFLLLDPVSHDAEDKVFSRNGSGIGIPEQTSRERLNPS
jgi:hypothetical protein